MARPALLLVVVISSWAASAAAAARGVAESFGCEGGELLAEGYTCEGGKISSLTIEASRGECRDRCLALANCVGLQYDRSGKHCFLFSILPSGLGNQQDGSECELMPSTCIRDEVLSGSRARREARETQQCVNCPTQAPTQAPTQYPTMYYPEALLNATRYIPGNLVTQKEGILLSEGLDLKIIARAGRKVMLKSGGYSSETFHERPDFGAIYPSPSTDSRNPGGWIYLSNSEMKDGGVGRIVFDRNGEVLWYDMALTGTTRNCAGGKTPWDTFITCEEPYSRDGQVYEVNPTGLPIKKPPTVLGGDEGGRFESFAYDIRNPRKPHFFVTEDHEEGALRRFTPSAVDWARPWNMLYDRGGEFQYLVLVPDPIHSIPIKSSCGTYYWTSNKTEAEASAFHCELRFFTFLSFI